MPTTASAVQIRSDFDTIARLMPERDRLGPYEAWLLRHVPAGQTALEIGCGVGQLARRLSFDKVTAIDFSEGMIAEARRRGGDVEFVCADLFEWLRAHRDAYDCIVTVATLHHVDLRSALREMAAALRPGGTLLVLDLIDRPGVLVNALAMIVSLGRLVGWKLRRAYWRHGRNETYLRIEEVERIAREELPGAKVREHLLWRYSLVWSAAAVPPLSDSGGMAAALQTTPSSPPRDGPRAPRPTPRPTASRSRTS